MFWPRMDSYLALDTETTGVNLRHGAKPFMVTTCNPEGKQHYWEWPVNPFTRQPKIPTRDKREIQKHLAGKRIVFHHAKYDIRALAEIGVFLSFPEKEWDPSCLPHVLQKVSNPIIAECKGFEDTLPASHVDYSKGTHKLKELALVHLDYPDDDEDALHKKVASLTRKAKKLGYNLAYKMNKAKDREIEADFWLPKVFDPDDETCVTYGLRDVERTILLWMKVYLPLFKKDALARRCYFREKKIIPVLYATEHEGITIGKRSTKLIKQQMQDEAGPLRQRAIRIANKRMGVKDFNLNSYPQKRALLYDSKKGFRFPVLEYTIDKYGKPTSNPATDAKVLERLRDDHCDEGSSAWKYLDCSLRSNKYSKGVEYIESYEQKALPCTLDSRLLTLYPSYNPNGTDTTRKSCSNPNGTNVSKKSEAPLRNIFEPPRGYVWYPIDYKQLQLVIFAYLAGDKKLIQSFIDGHDFHETTAVGLYKIARELIDELKRRVAKNTNFSLIFGAKKNKVNKTAGVPWAWDRYNDAFPSAARFIKESTTIVKKNGFVRTPFGYPLWVNPSKAYSGANYRVQGCEGDMVKNAMIMISALKLVDWIKSRIALQVHDELIFQFPVKHDTRIIRKIMGVMEYAGEQFGMQTPVDASIVTTHWGAKEKVDLKPIRPNTKLCNEIIFGRAA